MLAAAERVEPPRGGKSKVSSAASGRNHGALGIHTGDQVVEFYARHGQTSGVKFFYCNQQPRTAVV